ncbi:hypothetical protein LMG22037_05328 [Paraburkholderia phenoliruptrix]|uniref:Uncharacterized protein n=1 Tax=Paraburkholderia phenoliruptrix TaxID=252970 RepID=A0A6J5C6P6_9BURK|nr:hypothetical protein LMG22037_05328 [Paraburkholderia phenoliruptrix]
MQYEGLIRDAHEESLESLELSRPDKVLVSVLAHWVQHVAPLEPLPMSASDAIALAECVHKAIGGKYCRV